MVYLCIYEAIPVRLEKWSDKIHRRKQRAKLQLLRKLQRICRCPWLCTLYHFFRVFFQFSQKITSDFTCNFGRQRQTAATGSHGHSAQKTGQFHNLLYWDFKLTCWKKHDQWAEAEACLSEISAETTAGQDQKNTEGTHFKSRSRPQKIMTIGSWRNSETWTLKPNQRENVEVASTLDVEARVFFPVPGPRARSENNAPISCSLPMKANDFSIWTFGLDFPQVCWDFMMQRQCQSFFLILKVQVQRLCSQAARIQDTAWCKAKIFWTDFIQHFQKTEQLWPSMVFLISLYYQGKNDLLLPLALNGTWDVDSDHWAVSWLLALVAALCFSASLSTDRSWQRSIHPTLWAVGFDLKVTMKSAMIRTIAPYIEMQFVNQSSNEFNWVQLQVLLGAACLDRFFLSSMGKIQPWYFNA